MSSSPQFDLFFQSSPLKSADYEEYTITQDEWGYVFLEVEAGEEDKFTGKMSKKGT